MWQPGKCKRCCAQRLRRTSVHNLTALTKITNVPIQSNKGFPQVRLMNTYCQWCHRKHNQMLNQMDVYTYQHQLSSKNSKTMIVSCHTVQGRVFEFLLHIDFDRFKAFCYCVIYISFGELLLSKWQGWRSLTYREVTIIGNITYHQAEESHAFWAVACDVWWISLWVLTGRQGTHKGRSPDESVH